MNQIQTSIEDKVIWCCDGKDKPFYSPSFSIGGALAHMFCEKRELFIRTFDTCVWISLLICEVSLQMTPRGTRRTADSGRVKTLSHRNFALTSEPYKLGSSDLMCSGVTFTTTLQYKLKHAAKPRIKKALSPSSYISGLTNQGATCYINVILQILFYIPCFRRSVLLADPNQSLLLTEIQKLFTKMLTNTYALQELLYKETCAEKAKISTFPVDTKDFMVALSMLMPNVNVQGDAQEFFLFLLDQLMSTSLKECIKDLFLIVGNRVLKRKRKRNEGSTVQSEDLLDKESILNTISQEDFFLSVPISSKATLINNLATVFTKETLDTANEQQTTSRYSITRLPKMLVLSFQRVFYNAETAKLVKNPTPIALEKELDMYCVDKSLDPKDTKYVLASIVTHRGSGTCGHYFAYVIPYLDSHGETPSCTSEDSERATYTDEDLVGPACTDLSSASVIFLINDAHVTQMKLNEAISMTYQMHETIYMAVYLKKSAFHEVCKPYAYTLGTLYHNHLHDLQLKIGTALSSLRRQAQVNIRLATYKSINLLGSAKDELVITDTIVHKLSKLSGLESILPRETSVSILSVFPLYTINNRISRISQPLSVYDITMPICDLIHDKNLVAGPEEQIVWYYSNTKSYPSSNLYFLICYFNKTDTFQLSDMIKKGLANEYDAPLRSEVQLDTNLKIGYQFIEDLILDPSLSTSDSNHKLMKLLHRRFIQYILSQLFNSPSNHLVKALEQYLTVTAYHYDLYTRDFYLIDCQNERTVKSGAVYLGLNWNLPMSSNIPVDPHSQTLDQVISVIKDQIEVILEPLELSCMIDASANSFKLAGLFIDVFPTSLVQDVLSQLPRRKLYCADEYVENIMPLNALPAIKLLLSRDSTLEEISHRVYSELSSITIATITQRSTKMRAYTVTLDDFLNAFQISFPACVQDENKAYYNHKYDAYIPGKGANPPNEHVMLYLNNEFVSKSFHLAPSGLQALPMFHNNACLNGKMSLTDIEPEQWIPVTINDILKREIIDKEPVTTCQSPFSSTGLSKKHMLSQARPNARLSGDQQYVQNGDSRVLRLKYALPRVRFEHLAAIRPVRVLLVVHNIPITDLVLPMPRESNWQKLRILITQVKNLLQIVFNAVQLTLPKQVLSLSNVNGCLVTFLSDPDRSLHIIRGAPINPSSVLRYDVCEGSPDAILHYKTSEDKYTGISQIISVDKNVDITPDIILEALRKSHLKAKQFLDAYKISGIAQSALRGYAPDARLLWTPTYSYSRLQEEIITAGESMHESCLMEAKTHVKTDTDSSYVNSWIGKVQRQFDTSIASDDKLLMS